MADSQEDQYFAQFDLRIGYNSKINNFEHFNLVVSTRDYILFVCAVMFCIAMMHKNLFESVAYSIFWYIDWCCFLLLYCIFLFVTFSYIKITNK